MPTQWNRPKMTYADVVKEPKTQQGQRITTNQMNSNRPDRIRKTSRETKTHPYRKGQEIMTTQMDMNRLNETEGFLDQKPKRTNRPTNKGPTPYYLELAENRYAITWLKRNMEGERGEKQLRELQKEIENEYGIKMELVAEKENEKQDKDEENQRNKLEGIIENQ